MRNIFVTIAAALLLCGCYPQWNGPALQANSLPTPAFLQGVWSSTGSNEEVISFGAAGNKQFLRINDSDGVFQFPVLFSKIDDVNIISIDLRNMSKLPHSIFPGLSGIPRRGYMIFEFEQIDDEDLLVRSIISTDDSKWSDNIKWKNICPQINKTRRENLLNRITEEPCRLADISYFDGKSSMEVKSGLGGVVLTLHRLFRN